MRRVLKIILGLVVTAAIAMAFGWAFTWKLGLAAQSAREVLLLYAAAVAVLSALLVAGTVLPVRGFGYYIIAGGIVFLAVDTIVWWRFGILPGPKFHPHGFVPAGAMGVFLGPVYRILGP
jgi:hypothetical protein